MNLSFTLINNLVDFLTPMKCDWFVSGGWAIDIHLGRITRKRCDLDISVPSSSRLACLQFFLEKDWQIEGKLLGGFKRLAELSDYRHDIHCFWSFPKDADFIGEYVDEKANRRITYDREYQVELDYIEVFFDRIEGTQFIYRREPRVKRQVQHAILKENGIRYLAPEVVLLYKSSDLSAKNRQDFESVVESLNEEQKTWLKNALSLVYGTSHVWLEQM